ncbi:MAG: phosphoribosylanthranilate isomerase [Chloroflexi bacterium]|nr:phosphoribosylanthranilate isomerase [Chloroflexota bacterium]
MSLQVKICAITSFQDAVDAVRAGATLLGLNFYRPSPRYIQPGRAGDIAAGLHRAFGDRTPTLVGVFVNEAPGNVLHIMEAVGLDAAQLSGDEPPEALAALFELAFKAIRPRSAGEARHLADAYLAFAPSAEHLPALLLDAYHPDRYGGSGEQASTDVAKTLTALTPKLMVAGGLTPENVAERVAAIRPWGVDVASGVEGAIKGRKDAHKMKAFVLSAQQGANSNGD